MFAPPKIIFSCYVPGSMLPGDFFCKYKSPRYRLMHLHWGDLWITGFMDYWITGLLQCFLQDSGILFHGGDVGIQRVFVGFACYHRVKGIDF